MKNQFKKIFKGKTVIVGVGNPLRGDDGAGPALIAKLKAQTNLSCIDAGCTPENYLDKIIRERPNNILIIDALHLDKNPGEYAILNKGDILKSGFSTHDVSVHMFIEYLERQTSADIYLLGVQPKKVCLGEEMSKRVKKALDEIARLIKEENNARIPSS